MYIIYLIVIQANVKACGGGHILRVVLIFSLCLLGQHQLHLPELWLLQRLHFAIFVLHQGNFLFNFNFSIFFLGTLLGWCERHFDWRNNLWFLPVGEIKS